MLSIEKNERGFVVRRNGIGILEPFEKIKYDPNFENFYMVHVFHLSTDTLTVIYFSSVINR